MPLLLRVTVCSVSTSLAMSGDCEEEKEKLLSENEDEITHQETPTDGKHRSTDRFTILVMCIKHLSPVVSLALGISVALLVAMVALIVAVSNGSTSCERCDAERLDALESSYLSLTAELQSTHGEMSTIQSHYLKLTNDMADIKREIQDLHQNLSTLASSQIDLAEDVDISQFRHLVNQTFESFDLRIEDLSYQVSNVSATLENLTSLLESGVYERMNDLSSHILNDTFNLLQSYNSHVDELGRQVSALSVAQNSSMQLFKAFEGDILEQVKKC